MSDSFYLPIGQRIQSARGDWYRNLQRLGQGGNAVTFLAVATSGSYRGIPFAVKLFRKLSKPERRESFLRETAFLFTCNHPSVMRVFDSGVVHADKKSYPFLVAEYLPDTLDNVIDAGDIGIVEKVSFAMQLLSALAYLHSLEPPVIHRDIKPQNIFVKGKSCVLGDLGLMKQVGSQRQQDGGDFKESIGGGMPRNYRTPDQVAYLKQEQPLTTKSDVFQLGLVLAELFTGQNPQLPASRLTDPVKLEQLRDFRDPLSPSIKNLIEQMLESDAAVRKPADWFQAAWDGIFQAAVRNAYDRGVKPFTARIGSRP